jgi:hypothetical protein
MQTYTMQEKKTMTMPQAQAVIQKRATSIHEENRKAFGFLFRVYLMGNGLLDLFILGIFPLLVSVKLMPPVNVGFTVQTIFPAFVEGGLMERLMCYGFIACGASRLVSGLALFNGQSKTADCIAAGTYVAELLMLLLESELFKTTPPSDPVVAGIVLCILTAGGLVFGTQLRSADDELYEKLDFKSEQTSSLLRYWMIFNGLVIDIFMMGLIPLMAAARLIPTIALPLTVQSVFPSFVVSGLEERLCLYAFIVCGCCRLGAGMGKFVGCSRSADIVAMISYCVEILMVLMESTVFNSTPFAAVLPALIICPACVAALLLGQLQAYTCDGLYKKAKAD